MHVIIAIASSARLRGECAALLCSMAFFRRMSQVGADRRSVTSESLSVSCVHDVSLNFVKIIS